MSKLVLRVDSKTKKLKGGILWLHEEHPLEYIMATLEKLEKSAPKLRVTPDGIGIPAPRHALQSRKRLIGWALDVDEYFPERESFLVIQQGRQIPIPRSLFAN